MSEENLGGWYPPVRKFNEQESSQKSIMTDAQKKEQEALGKLCASIEGKETLQKRMIYDLYK